MCFERVDIKIEIQEAYSVMNVLSTSGFLVFTVKNCGDPKKLTMYKES
jgi:hypothetical protein